MTQPLEPLMSALDRARQTIGQLGTELRRNEDQTRQSLINPILRELGWETANPAAVRNQFPIKQNRVDYALMAERDDPIAIVEAKRLGESIENNLSQLIAYAYDAPVQFAAITDGNIWEIYRVEHDEESFTFRRLSRTTISTDPLNEVAVRLLQLSHENLGSEQPFEIRVIPLVAEVTESNGVDPESDGPPTDDSWVALSEFSPPAGTRAPTSIRFPGNSDYHLSKWSEMVVEVANWLYDSGHLKTSDVPIVYSDSGHIHSQPVNREGENMDNPYQIRAKDLFVETAGTGNTVIQRSTNILNQFKIDPATVHVRPSTARTRRGSRVSAEREALEAAVWADFQSGMTYRAIAQKHGLPPNGSTAHAIVKRMRERQGG